MEWEECLGTDVYERNPNPEEARSLLRMARIRQEDNERRERSDDYVPLVVESYWETVKQLVTALLALNGYKSYSQECLVAFLAEFENLSQEELERVDQLRRLRNDIDYRGDFLTMDYLDRNEDTIRDIISELEQSVKTELEGGRSQ